MDLNKSENFWEDLFLDYNFKQKLNLPYDDKLFNSISTGSFYSFNIDKSLTRQIFRYKNKMNITLFRLFLSTFYVYLFKLTQDKDICITGTTTNRFREELNNIIGPVENLIVYRFEIDPNKSFNQFIKQIEELCLKVKENGFYPYQNLISYARKFSSIQFPFSQVSLRVHIDDDQWILDIDNNLILKQISLNDHQLFKGDNKLTPIELTLNVKCFLEKQIIQFYFEYSNKLFEEKTIQLLAERFQKILKHLFDVSSNFDLDEEPIYKVSIILSDEERLINKLNVNKD
jgi:non-ribosomal peptide synthetase component F